MKLEASIWFCVSRAKQVMQYEIHNEGRGNGSFRFANIEGVDGIVVDVVICYCYWVNQVQKKGEEKLGWSELDQAIMSQVGV